MKTRRLERELDSELRYHFDRLVDDHVRRGRSTSDARRRARLEFGGIDQLKDGCRDVRAVGWLGELARDLRLSMRRLRRSPTVTSSVVATLGLGIGATVTMFTIVNGVLFASLPYPGAGTLTRLLTVHGTDAPGGYLSLPDFSDIRGRANSFDGVAAYSPWPATITGHGHPELLAGAVVSRDFFRVLGLTPLHGRPFLDSEHVRGQDAVIAISRRLWQVRFGASPTVVGDVLSLNGVPHTVVAIVPDAFGVGLPGLSAVDLWRPLGDIGAPAESLPGREQESFRTVARLNRHISLEAAQAELAGLSRALAREYPGTNTDQVTTAQGLHEAAVGSVRQSLLVLLGAVGVLFLLALTNVANLMLGWSASRSREWVTRTALGASRRRLVTHLLADGLVLAMLGAVTGLLAGTLVTSTVLAWSAGTIPVTTAIELDAGVVVFALACGLASALVLTAVGGRPLVVSVGSAGPRGRLPGAGARLRQALVVAGIALSLVLLTGSTLVTRSLWNLHAVDPGFDQNVAAFRVSPPAARYPTEDALRQFYERLVTRVQTTPGVVAAGSTGAAPFSGVRLCGTLFAEEDPDRFGGRDVCAEVRPVSPGYFEALRIPILQGRGLSAADRAATPDVVVISESTARLLWPGRSPLGRRLATGLIGRVHEVVGVVPDIKQFWLSETPPLQTYLPVAQWVPRTQMVVARAVGDAEALIPLLREAVRDVDDELALTRVGTLAEFVDQSVATDRLRVRLLLSFSLLAVLFAIVGVYGVVSYSVRRQRQSLAIRLALGANATTLFAGVLTEGLRLAAAGVAIGLMGAYGATRLLAGFLYGIAPNDPLTLGAASVFVVVVTACACLLPALRAAHTDPLAMLKAE